MYGMRNIRNDHKIYNAEYSKQYGKLLRDPSTEKPTFRST